jgi:uncharacterized membrane protein YeaQ/YmgE (transglycosylase-associated protein family)
MSDLLVFAVIGMLAGAAARLWYSGREPMQVLATMLVGVVGAVLAGMISWAEWSAADGRLEPGALLTSLLGAVFALGLWACIAFGRSVRVPSTRP